MQRLMHTQCLASTFKIYLPRISGGPKIANIIHLIINIFSFYTSQSKSMQSLGIFGGLSIMSKIIRQADGVHLGLPSSKENISSTGRMIKTGLNTHHSFWTHGIGTVPCLYLPVWSRMTQEGTRANSTDDMEQKEALQHPQHNPRPRHRIRLPQLIERGAEKEEVNERDLQGGDGGEAPWDSSGDVTRGQAPHSINHQHGSVHLCRPASIGPENLPQPLEHFSGLFWPHGQSSHEQQVHGQSLP